MSIVVDSQNEAEERRGLHTGGLKSKLSAVMAPSHRPLYMKRSNYALNDVIFKYAHIEDTVEGRGGHRIFV